MKRQAMGKARAAVLAGLLSVTLTACGGGTAATSSAAEIEQDAAVEQTSAAESSSQGDEGAVATQLATAATDGVMNTADLFTSRDLEQTANTSDATSITVQSGEDISITEEGVYVISGEATDVTITVNADSSAKVQLVLDGVSIQNEDAAAIYVVSADKVFVTTAEGSSNELSVTGTFAADGSTNVDAAIFSKDDLVLNGLGTLAISSTANGVSSHDDLKVTGGTYVISCEADGLEAHDNVLVANGDITISTNKDAIHAENSEDDTVGNVYVADGSLSLLAAGDGIQATAALQIDGGTLKIDAAEALEATYVQVNGGYLSISASDDGMNASAKSSLYTPTLEIRGGDVVISMASGDTDALDSNGNLYVSGGIVDITAQFAFDFDGEGVLSGGTVYVNGEQVTTIQNSMQMGGGMGGDMRGGPGMTGGPGR